MKCRALKHYTDKPTGKSVWKGTVVEISDERAKILIEDGFVEEIKDKKEKKNGK